MADQEQPEYLLGRVADEIDRLSKQHIWLQAVYKGQIVFAPVDLQKPGLRVLDVGCADGLLLRDLQKRVSPSAKLVGADAIAAFLPKDNPADNIRYVVADIGEPLATDLQNAFDLTHVRFTLAGASKAGINVAVQHLVAAVAPGGWLQVQENDLVEDSPAYTPALKDLIYVMRALFEKIGAGANWSNQLETMFREAGLENVTAQRYEIPLGIRLGDEIGAINSVEPFKISVPSLVEGAVAQDVKLPDSVTDSLYERFEKEMMNQGGSMFTIIVTGQKPLSR